MKKLFLVAGVALILAGCCRSEPHYIAPTMPKLDVKHIPYNRQRKIPVRILPIPDLGKQVINIIPL